MIDQHTPQQLQDACIELETARWLWQSTEDHIATLIDATVERIKDEAYPFYEDVEEETILQRERVEVGMRRTARATAVIQAWVIFEDAAGWVAEELERRGTSVPRRRAAESFAAWAERALSLYKDSVWRRQFAEGLDILCRLRNLLVHVNGQTSRMKPGELDRLSELTSSQWGIRVSEDRLELQPHCVAAMFDVVLLALSELAERLRLPAKPHGTNEPYDQSRVPGDVLP